MDLVWGVCVCGHPYTHELSYISIPHFTSWSLYIRKQCSRSKLEQYEGVSRNPVAPRPAAAWGHSAEEVPLLTVAGASRGEMPLCRLFCWRPPHGHGESPPRLHGPHLVLSSRGSRRPAASVSTPPPNSQVWGASLLSEASSLWRLARMDCDRNRRTESSERGQQASRFRRGGDTPSFSCQLARVLHPRGCQSSWCGAGSQRLLSCEFLSL